MLGFTPHTRIYKGPKSRPFALELSISSYEVVYNVCIISQYFLHHCAILSWRYSWLHHFSVSSFHNKLFFFLFLFLFLFSFLFSFLFLFLPPFPTPSPFNSILIFILIFSIVTFFFLAFLLYVSLFLFVFIFVFIYLFHNPLYFPTVSSWLIISVLSPNNYMHSKYLQLFIVKIWNKKK